MREKSKERKSEFKSVLGRLEDLWTRLETPQGEREEITSQVTDHTLSTLKTVSSSLPHDLLYSCNNAPYYTLLYYEYFRSCIMSYTSVVIAVIQNVAYFVYLKFIWQLVQAMLVYNMAPSLDNYGYQVVQVIASITLYIDLFTVSISILGNPVLPACFLSTALCVFPQVIIILVVVSTRQRIVFY